MDSELNHKQIQNFFYNKDDHKSSGTPYQRHRELYLFCNLIELLRLKEELLFSFHENNVLEGIYKDQRQDARLDSGQHVLYFQKPLLFGRNDNAHPKIDINDGSRIELQFKAFRDFDDRLKAYIDFTSPKCIGYLVSSPERKLPYVVDTRPSKTNLKS